MGAGVDGVGVAVGGAEPGAGDGELSADPDGAEGLADGLGMTTEKSGAVCPVRTHSPVLVSIVSRSRGKPVEVSRGSRAKKQSGLARLSIRPAGRR